MFKLSDQGGMVPCAPPPPLATPVTVVQPGFVIGGQSKGAKRPRGRGVHLPPYVIFFEMFVYQNDIFCTLNVIIRGRLCVLVKTNPQLSLPSVFFYSPINGGGGGGGAVLERN